MKASETYKTIKIVGTTLRDGEQAPGVSVPLENKLRIAEMLDHAGVDELEAGIPAMGDQAQGDIREIVRLGLLCQVTSWCRATAKDIAMARRCRASGLHISFPVSSIHLKAMDKNETWVLKELERLIPMALWDFDYVTVGAQDATRADLAFLGSFIILASDAGASRVRIADTVGTSTPFSVHRLICRLKRLKPGILLEFHGHNDLGMATANTISAISAGVLAVSVTVNGLGERCGNAALEEVVQAIKFINGFKTGMEMNKIIRICGYVAEASSRPIPPAKPVTGAEIFTHESGIHCAALLKDPLSYQPFLPQTLGRRGTRFSLGAHSGSRAIQYLLAQAGIAVSEQEAARFKKVLSDHHIPSDE